MAKASAAPAPQNITSTPVTEVSGGAAAQREVLAGKTERWSDTEGDMPALSGTPEVVETYDGGLGEQNKAEQIMIALRGDGTTEEYTLAPTKVEKADDDEKAPEAKVEAKADDKPVTPPTRKDLLANISAEKKARALEKQVAELQAKNKLLTEGSIADAMKARGLTREQAMERLVLEGTGVAAPPAQNPLEAEVERLSKIAARAEDAEVLGVVKEHLADVDVPTVKRAIDNNVRIPVPRDDGTAVYQSAHQLIAELCEQLWVEQGKPTEAEKPRRSFIPEASKLLDQALREQFGSLFGDAKAEPTKAAAKAPVPSVGKRGGPPRSNPNTDPYASLDDYSRRLAIKRDFGV